MLLAQTQSLCPVCLRLVDAALTKHLEAALRLKDPARHRQEKFAAMGRAWIREGHP